MRILVFVYALFSILPVRAEGLAMSGIGFTAPNVFGFANVGNPSVGDIIFDTNANKFYGYAGAAGWGVLRQLSKFLPLAPAKPIFRHAK